MIRKRGVILLLIIMLLIVDKSKLLAAGEGNTNDINLEFKKDGTLLFTTSVKQATSGVKYKTLGWTIYDANNRSNMIRVNMRQVGVDVPDPNIPGNVITTFETDRDLILDQMGKVQPKWRDTITTDGGWLYLDAIMTVVENGVEQGAFYNKGTPLGQHTGEVYYTEDGIKNARGWAKPEDLANYFNKRVWYEPIYGTAFIQHFLLPSGTKIPEFPDEQKPLVKDQPYTFKPSVHEYYEYEGYKVNQVNPPPAGIDSIIDNKKDPQYTMTYPGTYKKLYLNFYYYPKGKAIIKHFTKDGKSLDTVFKHKEEKLVYNEQYEYNSPSDINYKYVGYKESNDTIPPTGQNFTCDKLPNSECKDPAGLKYNGSFKVKYIYFYYDVIGKGKVNVRHMVRADSSSSFKLVDEEVVAVQTLPATKDLTANSSYGKILGQNKSYSGYLNDIQVGDRISVELTDDKKTAYVTFFYEGKGATVPGPGESSSDQDMDPRAEGVIKADARDAELFDVTKGIPTSESLYTNVLSKNYLYRNTFVEKKDIKVYNVPVSKTYTLTWTEKVDKTEVPKSDIVTVQNSYLVERKYSYWEIENLEIYGLKQAQLSNYALPNESSTMYPNGYTLPTVDATHQSGESSHIIEPQINPVALPPETISGGSSKPSIPSENWQSEAEDSVPKIKVKNDRLIFNGQTIMSDQELEEIAPKPGKIPAPTIIDRNVFYKSNQVISNSKQNRRDMPSTGTLHYQLVKGIGGGEGEKAFPILGVNSVTVHTPVVKYSVLPDSNRPFDQRMVPDMTRTVLILDRPFTINFTESGQHLNIPGYGNRDYRKYTLLKRVMFPFDTYSDDKREFYPKNSWVSIPVGQASKSFKMPTWVTEGNYQIRTESWAVNSAGQNTCQQNYNGDLNNYCAVQTFDVGVVGRLFGFRIWDIGDLRFEEVFRTAKGSSNHTTSSYFSGGRDENGDPTNMLGKNSWILPVRSGSHPTYTANVAHNGYPFLFDFKTIGNVWDKGEGIRIDPSFYFVSRKGGTPIPVDLYYDASGTSNKMIQVGSERDQKTYTRLYQLPDKLRNITSQELTNAARYEYNSILSADQRAKQTWDTFYKAYLSRKVTIGLGYQLEILPYKSRTLIGPTNIPASVDPTEALRSVQHWYGEYHLPIAPYILPKGTNILTLANQYGGKINGHEKEFLKNGYIVVHFDIYTLRNNDQEKRILGYDAPIANMWAIEGQVTSSKDYLGNTFVHRYGDMMYFESDFSVRNDFQGSGR